MDDPEDTDVVSSWFSYQWGSLTVEIEIFCRHNLRKDVRESLYSEAHFWMKAIGKKRQFLGGNVPNLADLVNVFYEVFVLRLSVCLSLFTCEYIRVCILCLTSF